MTFPKPTQSSVSDTDQNLETLKDIRRSLRDSQERYRTVFENTGTATFVMAPDKTISLINSGFERLTGLSKSEAEGKVKLSDLICEPDKQRLLQYKKDRRGISVGPKELSCAILDQSGEIKDVLLKLDMIPSTGE